MQYSIIIPTLNEEKLLPGLLNQLNDELLRKKFEFEIIVSDGGSNDGTVEIALKSSDVVLVHTKREKQNIAFGRNSGAKLAKSNILIFINADVLIPNIKLFFEYIENNFVSSGYSAMTCDVKVFPEEEIIYDKLFHTGYNGYFRMLNSLGLGMGRGECQVVKKNIFESMGGYNESLAAGEDFDLFRRIRKVEKILFTSDICVHESPRRYRRLGYRLVTTSWIRNGLSILLKDKSLSESWEQVR